MLAELLSDPSAVAAMVVGLLLYSAGTGALAFLLFRDTRIRPSGPATETFTKVMDSTGVRDHSRPRRDPQRRYQLHAEETVAWRPADVTWVLPKAGERR